MGKPSAATQRWATIRRSLPRAQVVPAGGHHRHTDTDSRRIARAASGGPRTAEPLARTGCSTRRRPTPRARHSLPRCRRHAACPDRLAGAAATAHNAVGSTRNSRRKCCLDPWTWQLGLRRGRPRDCNGHHQQQAKMLEEAHDELRSRPERGAFPGGASGRRDTFAGGPLRDLTAILRLLPEADGCWKLLLKQQDGAGVLSEAC